MIELYSLCSLCDYIYIKAALHHTTQLVLDEIMSAIEYEYIRSLLISFAIQLDLYLCLYGLYAQICINSMKVFSTDVRCTMRVPISDVLYGMAKRTKVIFSCFLLQ